MTRNTSFKNILNFIKIFPVSSIYKEIDTRLNIDIVDIYIYDFEEQSNILCEYIFSIISREIMFFNGLVQKESFEFSQYVIYVVNAVAFYLL